MVSSMLCNPDLLLCKLLVMSLFVYSLQASTFDPVEVNIICLSKIVCFCICSLISTSKDHPVHLWDAFTGHIRCSYLSFNHLVGSHLS